MGCRNVYRQRQITLGLATDLSIKLLVAAGVHKTHRPHLAPSTRTVLVCTAAQFDAIVDCVRS